MVYIKFWRGKFSRPATGYECIAHALAFDRGVGGSRGSEDARTWGRGTRGCGTRGRGTRGRGDVGTRGLEDVLEEFINKQHITFALNL